MPRKKASLLITKFLLRSANRDDLDGLESILEKRKARELFRDYIKLNFLIGMAFDNSDIEKTKKVLLERIKKDKRHEGNRQVFSLLKYAALILVLVSVGYYANKTFFGNGKEPLMTREDVVTLQLGNGETKIVSDSVEITIQDKEGNVIGSQNGNTIVYEPNPKTEAITENTLNVPYGKKFDLILADGTKIFLNSGSSLKYPTSFKGLDTRQVQLSGEAYFEVAHDAQKPFLVNAQELQVGVLGTQFNISNYSEDMETEVVLVEGSVDLSTKSSDPKEPSRNIVLKPGFKGTFNKSVKTIESHAVDVSRYTSWIHGKEIFVDAPFENIIKKLERQYNVVIINKNKNIAEERFTATIETKHESIEQVLSFFNRVYAIEYHVLDNRIIIE